MAWAKQRCFLLTRRMSSLEKYGRFLRGEMDLLGMNDDIVVKNRSAHCCQKTLISLSGKKEGGIQLRVWFAESKSALL